MSKTEETLRECGRWICHSFDILKAIIIRLIFALHATIAIIRVVITKGDYWYLLNMCGVNFLLIELVVTIVKRKGKEPKWFSPCFFLYICTMIPPIWFLEINRINVKLGDVPINRTEGEELKSMIEKGLISRVDINDKAIREWGIEDAMSVELSYMFIIILGRWILPKGKISHSALSQLLLVYLSLASDILDLLTLFNEQEISRNLPMVYLVLLVFSLCMFQFALNLTATRGRSFYAEYDNTEIEIHQPASKPMAVSTLQPRKPMSRKAMPMLTTNGDQSMNIKPRASSYSFINLPDTIFENVATNKDYEMKETGNILIHKPTFPAVDPPKINLQQPMLISPSTTSLNSLQSSLWNVSRSKQTSRKSVAASVKFFVRKRSSKLLRSEIWSILVTLSLQDGPFFAVRLIAIIVFHVRSFLTYFFTFKNLLILLLQSYRIVSICFEKDEQEQEFQKKVETIRRMSIAASQLNVPLHRKL